MHLRTLLACGLLLNVLAHAPVHAQEALALDPGSSRLIWTGRDVTGSHTGTLDVANGTVQWNADGLAAASLALDMHSIRNTDLQPEMAARLERHLMNEDFFHAEVYPLAMLTTDSVAKIPGALPGEPNYTVTGRLTIKGITKPIRFQVLAWREGDRARMAGRTTFNRADHDVRYRSVRFFSDLGDRIIADEVEIAFDLSAK
jgi:polyisoprenoid-binding protein YceI